MTSNTAACCSLLSGKLPYHRRFAWHRIVHDRVAVVASQHNAAAASLSLLKGQESGTSSSLEHIVDALAAQAGALQIPLGADVSCNSLTFVLGNESHRLLSHVLDGDRIFSKVLLQADEDDGNAGAQSGGLLDPL